MLANISTFFQHCFLVDATWRRGAMSNQRWKNVVYFNVAVYSVEQRWINAVYFNVDMNNVRQRWNNVDIFNVDMIIVGKRGNNIVKTTISKKDETNHFKKIHGIRSFNCYFTIFFTLLTMLVEYLEEYL